MICEALTSGRKVLLCGNGGSAADAQHIAAELVGCYEKQRRSWPAIALTTDTSAFTAVSNDLGYEQVFARQVAGLAQTGDVLIAISTSGKSKNVLRAAEKARELGCKTIALTGATCEPLGSLCDVVSPCLRIALREFRKHTLLSVIFGVRWLINFVTRLRGYLRIITISANLGINKLDTGNRI